MANEEDTLWPEALVKGKISFGFWWVKRRIYKDVCTDIFLKNRYEKYKA